MDFEAQDDGVVAKILTPAGTGRDSTYHTRCLSYFLALRHVIPQQQSHSVNPSW